MLFRELSFVRRYDCMNYLETIDCHYLLNDHRLQLRHNLPYEVHDIIISKATTIHISYSKAKGDRL